MNIHDQHLDICAFADVVEHLDTEVLEALAGVNNEWNNIVGPVIEKIKCEKIAEYLGGTVAADGVWVNKRGNQPIDIRNLDIKLGSLMWLFKTFRKWNTRPKGSRKPIMRNLYSGKFFKLSGDFETIKNTTYFMLQVAENPFMAKFVNRVAWTYLIFVYIGLTYPFWEEHSKFIKTVLAKVAGLRRDIKGKGCHLPDDLRYHFTRVLDDVEEMFASE